MDIGGPTPEERRATQRQRISSSGWLTPGLVGLLCLALLIAAFERGHGNFHRLSDAVIAPPAQPALPTGPGGQDAIRLTRTATAIGSEPEFLSATLLPGRGMQVLQITASIPGHGEVPLLVAPPVAEATQVLSGAGADANGDLSSTVGGAFEVPWAERLSGTPGAAGMLHTNWNGQELVFPASSTDPALSVEGLLPKRGVDSIKTDVLPDGQAMEAVFHAGDFGGGWPSSVDVTLRVELSGHTLDFSLQAQNVGRTAVPMGVGWHPFFAIPSGDRANALLTLPSNTVLERNARGMPTGKTVSVAGGATDFLKANGVALGSEAIDETLVDLQSGVLADGPISELRDPGFNFGLRMIPLTPNITHLRVVAPTGKAWVSISPNTNAEDAFGSEWGNPAGAGMVLLQPGASLQWKVRLEISPLSSAVTPLTSQ